MAVDNLYIKRSNTNEHSKEILNFLDTAILDIKKFCGRKINIFAMSTKELSKNETKAALRARNVRRLPALYVNQVGATIHGVDSIKEFYFKLTQAYIQTHRQQLERDRELVGDGENQYDQLFNTEATTTGQDNQGDTAATSGIGAGGRGIDGEGDDGDVDLDLGSAYRDRLKHRGGGGPPKPKSRNPALGGTDTSMLDLEMPASMGGGTNAVSSCDTGDGGSYSIMDSVRRSAKSAGKDADLEVQFFANMLDETKT